MALECSLILIILLSELFGEETVRVSETVQEEAATKIQAAFRGHQAREQVKHMKEEIQVKPKSSSPNQHDNPPKHTSMVRPVSSDSAKCMDRVHGGNLGDSDTDSAHGSCSDSSSGLDDDFELVKDNTNIAMEYGPQDTDHIQYSETKDISNNCENVMTQNGSASSKPGAIGPSEEQTQSLSEVLNLHAAPLASIPSSCIDVSEPGSIGIDTESDSATSLQVQLSGSFYFHDFKQYSFITNI